MALYSVTANAAAASNAAKVAIQLATGAGITNRVVGFSVSFNGTDASKTPVLVELVKETGASSGGAAGTLTQADGLLARTVQTTCRTNDTTDGSSPTILESWYVSPTAALVIQYPLGREPGMAASSYLALRITTVTASGTPNYQASLWIEE